MEPELFNQGTRPALNVGISVSRVGSAAQTKAMKKVAGKLRLELAQFRELAAFAQFASDLDEATKKRIERGRVLTQILKQDELKPVPFERQVVLIFAATNGCFDGLDTDKVQKIGNDFVDYLAKMNSDIILEIQKSGEISKELEPKLKAVCDEFRKINSLSTLTSHCFLICGSIIPPPL